MFDKGTRVAVIREVEFGGRKLIRSVTWAAESADRRLLGYFPDLRLAAEVTWWEWRKAVEQTERA